MNYILSLLPEDNVSDWGQALRVHGRDVFEQTGLPTPKLERFKYTNIPARLKKMDLEFADSDVSIDGDTGFVRKLMEHMEEAPDWLKQMAQQIPAGAQQYQDMMLWDAANAYFRDGLTLDIPANYEGDKPLNITITGHADTHFVPRTFFVAGANSNFTVIEYHMGSGEYWNNRVTQIHVKEGARFRHYRMQENSDRSVYTQNTHIIVEEGGTYEAFVMTVGAGLSRNQVHVELKGAEAACYLNGINLLKGDQVGDTTITVEHRAESCISKQNYRSVLEEQSTGVFQGKVHVHKIAQKTDGYQLSNSLLLSERATMNTKPELEIYADDVKCSHGATSGKLDAEALFYLRSRGIDEDDARALLIEAFLSEVVDEISCDEMGEQVRHVVSRWLEALKPQEDIDL
ncbi:MAG: Fe-S cluster assembly protein SufD [Alphaproteobacteria bacterium]|nr:Fe-S cluster assembly protein SufD [Alphaproteobacteria bacterium]